MGYFDALPNSAMHPKIGNPDQRLSQDVDRLTDSAASALSSVVVVPGLVCYYTLTLLLSLGLVPVIVTYVYFIVGAVLNWLLVYPIAKRVSEQERREGHFRFVHFWVRSHATEISLLDGRNEEARRTS